jgi:hypothetical protein
MLSRSFSSEKSYLPSRLKCRKQLPGRGPPASGGIRTDSSDQNSGRLSCRQAKRVCWRGPGLRGRAFELSKESPRVAKFYVAFGTFVGI